MKQIAKYQNGNTTVTIFNDGTKIREYEGAPEILHPECIDVKITNYCDMGCGYCHENSNIDGLHADLSRLIEVISELPAGVELAIGGGNPLSHPNLIWFLQVLRKRGIIANITVNQGHLKTFKNIITYLIKEELVRGVGISITSNKNFNHVKPILEISENVVYHVIAGVNKVEVCERLIELSSKCKILVLGYKFFGLGVSFYNQEVNDELKRWYKKIPKIIGKCTLSFDNLAIEQLKVKRLFTHEGWDKFYMGDDFSFTMYIDAVKQQYAPTSRSDNRKPFSECSLLEYFSSRNEIKYEKKS